MQSPVFSEDSYAYRHNEGSPIPLKRYCASIAATHTVYDVELGFLSSSWKTCAPAADFEELREWSYHSNSSCFKSLKAHSH